MATGLVIHISAGKDKHTEVLTDEHIRIGSRDDCDVRLRLSSLPKSTPADGVVLELARGLVREPAVLEAATENWSVGHGLAPQCRSGPR